MEVYLVPLTQNHTHLFFLLSSCMTIFEHPSQYVNPKSPQNIMTPRKTDTTLSLFKASLYTFSYTSTKHQKASFRNSISSKSLVQLVALFRDEIPHLVATFCHFNGYLEPNPREGNQGAV